jgi:hypothetical protein
MSATEHGFLSYDPGVWNWIADCEYSLPSGATADPRPSGSVGVVGRTSLAAPTARPVQGRSAMLESAAEQPLDARRESDPRGHDVAPNSATHLGEYAAWLHQQPRTRQVAERLNMLCFMLMGASIQLDRAAMQYFQERNFQQRNGPDWDDSELRFKADPGPRIADAVPLLKDAVAASEKVLAVMRGIWTDLPKAVSDDPRSWETNLALEADRARMESAGMLMLIDLKREVNFLPSEDELQRASEALKAIASVLGERIAPLRAVPPVEKVAESPTKATAILTTTSDGAVDKGEANSSPPRTKDRRQPRARSKADQVRELLSGTRPYEKSKSELAADVGYTHSSALAHVKNFANLWSENERKLAVRRAQSESRMIPTAE